MHEKATSSQAKKTLYGERETDVCDCSPRGQVLGRSVTISVTMIKAQQKRRREIRLDEFDGLECVYA